MCDIGTAFSVISGVVGFMGSMADARAAQQQADFNAAVARNNEILANRAADDAILRGEAAAAKQGLQTRQFKARQRTALAASGIQVDEGTALDLSLDVGSVGREEEAIIRRNAEREALGFRTQGMNFAASATLAELKGEQAQRAAGFSALGSLLTIGSSFTPKKKLPKAPKSPFKINESLISPF
jgi:hypothetical protein